MQNKYTQQMLFYLKHLIPLTVEYLILIKRNAGQEKREQRRVFLMEQLIGMNTDY